MKEGYAIEWSDKAVEVRYPETPPFEPIPFDPENNIERSEARAEGAQAAIKKSLEDLP